MIKPSFIAIIPARGGSKGLKDKNLQIINGKSLIEIAIKKLLKIKFIKFVIVSSDNQMILKEAEKNGAIPILRPIEISGDFSESESAIIHALKNCKINIPLDSDIIFHQCTSPLLSSESINKAILKFQNSEATCIFSVANEFNPIWELKENGSVNILNPKNLKRGPRQKRLPYLIETGGIYVIDRKSFEKTSNRFGKNPIPIVVPKIESIDIDNKDDLEISKSLIKISQ